ncbi:MAG: 4Fe-4S dicluster domain-containing protein [Chloroflexi bacterium]|nr:4Fe-4S dicluster domain-containing protein [Chloroflexota bacterium]MBI2979560.1 4Fe-4S dicluster domain-containing protein [Chloroflexota bacterium]
MDEVNKIAALFVGAGPASLAGAIKLKQLLKQKGRNDSVVVIEKADKLGQHNLSGAVFEADVLNELIPGWKEKKDAFVTKTLANEVKIDETVFLPGGSSAIRLPETIVPKYMRHHGNYVLSLSEMVNWLAGIARELGVEIYTGFAAKELVVADNSVKGIKLGDKGLDKDKRKQSNYSPGEIIEAKVTVFGEGSLGQLSEKMVNRFNLGKGRNPQVYSLGVKEIIRLPEENNFGPNRVLHTLGFPNKMSTPDVFGGGTLYSLGKNTVAVALILALDWRYCNLNPQRELQLFKSHPFVSRLIEGGEVIAYGARTLPEGGYYSVPELATNGALIIGDAAGLTSVRKLKGLHYAIKSGIIAAEAIFQAIEEQDFSHNSLKRYQEQLNNSFVVKDIQTAKNYRQVFTKAGRAGLYLGAPLSLVQQWIPFRLGTKPDYEGMRRVRLDRQYNGGIDRLTAVSLSGTTHREDEPSHITFSEPTQCDSCKEKFGCHPCESFCPGEVYRFDEDNLILSPSNCLHCQTCRIKCPNQIIQWEVPEGGDGPRYKLM